MARLRHLRPESNRGGHPESSGAGLGGTDEDPGLLIPPAPLEARDVEGGCKSEGEMQLSVKGKLADRCLTVSTSKRLAVGFTMFDPSHGLELAALDN